MTIYCIRTRRPGEHSWQFVAPGYVLTDDRQSAMRWNYKHRAERCVPSFAKVWPEHELRVSPITAFDV